MTETSDQSLVPNSNDKTTISGYDEALKSISDDLLNRTRFVQHILDILETTE